MGHKTLILGGARSGKSAWAEHQAVEWAAAAAGREVVVVATGEARDEEMTARIAAHRARRPASWQTMEAPLALAEALAAADGPQRLLLVDCLTLWLSNLLLADLSSDVLPGGLPGVLPELDLDSVRALQPGPRWQAGRGALLDLLPRLRGELLLIGNEVGHGIVPLGAVNRLFVDESGRLHQALAAQCDRVRFVMAGCVLPLKG